MSLIVEWDGFEPSSVREPRREAAEAEMLREFIYAEPPTNPFSPGFSALRSGRLVAGGIIAVGPYLMMNHKDNPMMGRVLPERTRWRKRKR